MTTPAFLGDQDLQQLSSEEPGLISGFEPEEIIDMENDLLEGRRYLVKYKDAGLKLCTWETPRVLLPFRNLIDRFHTLVNSTAVKVGDGKRRFQKALNRIRKREERGSLSKKPKKKPTPRSKPAKGSQSAGKIKSQDTTTFNPKKVNSQESVFTLKPAVAAEPRAGASQPSNSPES